MAQEMLQMSKHRQSWSGCVFDSVSVSTTERTRAMSSVITDQPWATGTQPSAPSAQNAELPPPSYEDVISGISPDMRHGHSQPDSHTKIDQGHGIPERQPTGDSQAASLQDVTLANGMLPLPWFCPGEPLNIQVLSRFHVLHLKRMAGYNVGGRYVPGGYHLLTPDLQVILFGQEDTSVQRTGIVIGYRFVFVDSTGQEVLTMARGENLDDMSLLTSRGVSIGNVEQCRSCCRLDYKLHARDTQTSFSINLLNFIIGDIRNNYQISDAENKAVGNMVVNEFDRGGHERASYTINFHCENGSLKAAALASLMTIDFYFVIRRERGR